MGMTSQTKKLTEMVNKIRLIAGIWVYISSYDFICGAIILDTYGLSGLT